jgi:hypothetical protein
MQIIIFLLFAEGILALGHAIVYGYLVWMFPSLTQGQRTGLIISLSLLSVSFIVASVLIHVSESFLARGFYIAAGWWLGLLVNLLLAFLTVFIVHKLAKFASFGLDLSVLGMIAIVVAVIVSVYGAWNAFHPELKEITVHIKDLPEAWQGKRVVQLSDVHLGSVYQADFLRRVVDQVNAVRPEAVFITGDLFDGMDGALGTLVGPFRDMRSPRGTYFVTGNHETYLGVEMALSALEGTGIRIMDDQVVDLDGLKIVGIGFPLRGAADDTLAKLQSLQSLFASHPAILLYHAPVYVGEFLSAGISLQLSGHTHRGQQYPFNLITRYVYDGFDYGLREHEDYSIYTTNGVGTWGPAMRIGNTPEIVVITLEKK